MYDQYALDLRYSCLVQTLRDVEGSALGLDIVCAIPCHHDIVCVIPCHHDIVCDHDIVSVIPCHHDIVSVIPCHHDIVSVIPCHHDTVSVIPCHCVTTTGMSCVNRLQHSKCSSLDHSKQDLNQNMGVVHETLYEGCSGCHGGHYRSGRHDGGQGHLLTAP
ncbi:hypothetical protein MAR_014246 [Mya arenaria]|uniref:Uncharacterized protein n=1 Tax=Mya arenaria TaxID=6604 RepID=A0ABY7G5E6_MYAAR|nr:hypothetical protein MAR_014246 [Mya arenaria]